MRKESQVEFDERGTARRSTDDPKRARSRKRSIPPRISLSRIIDPVLIGSVNNERKGFVLFLSPFCGSFFHQGLQWLLLVLFLAVFAFAHDR